MIATAALAAATCQLSDILRPVGAKNVAIAYQSDSIVVQGRAVAAAATATAGGAPLRGAKFLFTSSDTSVLSVRGGDTLVAVKRGTAKLTIRLAGAILPQSPPAISRTIRVVAASVQVDSAHVTLASLGDTVTLHATPLDADSAPIPGAVSWQSSDTTVVAVTAAGKLTALKNGAATVRATIDFDTAATPVIVHQTLVHFTFDQAPVVIDALGATATVTPTARDARGNAIAGVTPAWSSGDTTVATVSAAGAVTSVRTGSTYLYARQGTVADSLPVAVAQRATRVLISPKPVPAITSLTNQRQLTAVAYDRRNVLIPSPPLAWSALDPTVVSVSPQGLVTGLALGATRVYAGAGAGLDSVTVTVTNQPASVRVTPRSAASTSTGDTLLFTAAAFNGRGDTVSGVTFSWRTPDTALVRVTSDGHAILKGVGAPRVVAVVGTLADTATITATNVPVTLHFKLPSGVTVGPLQRAQTAIGDVDTTPVVIQNARNADLSRGSVNWSVDDPRIVSVTSLGIVTARDTGQTLVRMTGSGLTDSAMYTVTNTPTSLVIEGRLKDTLTALGQVLPFVVDVKNHRGRLIANYPVTWRSTVTTVADTVVRDTVTAKGFGTTLLIATAGAVADTFTLVVKHLSRWTVDNSSVVSPRAGSALRPYAQIQDAVNAAAAKDTVVVKVGAGAYSETIALSRSLTLLGDSSAFVTGGRNPALLPLVGHDSGAAGIAAYTTAPMTLRYLALRHSLDGPAVDGSGSDMKIEYFYVNPVGSVTSRIGRGISIKNSVSGTSILRSEVDSARGYGIRLQTVSGAVVSAVVIRGVDSLPGVEEGAGIKALAASADIIHANFVRRAQIGVLVGGASSNVRVDSNDVTLNTVGMQLDGGSLAASSTNNDIYSNDSAGVVNPLGSSLSFPTNWWGDSAGPRNSGNVAATGDSAQGNISYATVKKTPTYAGTAATGLLIVRGNSQTAPPNSNLPLALAVRVVDANGFPVAGVSVTFTITVGSGGRLGSSGNVQTLAVTADAGGLAQTILRLGSAGPFTVTVTGTTVTIGSVAFTETAQ